MPLTQALLQAMREEQLDTLKRIADDVQQVEWKVLHVVPFEGWRLCGFLSPVEILRVR